MILLKCWRYRHMYYWRIYNFVTEMRFAVRKSTAFVKNKKRKHCKINVSASYMRAADGNRTRDLRTTNATLYRLSHSSNPVRSPHANLGYIIMNIWDCQQIFKKVFKNIVTVLPCIFLPAYSGQEASGIRPMKIQTGKLL